MRQVRYATRAREALVQELGGAPLGRPRKDSDGRTQRWLAEKLGIAQPLVSLWVTGRLRPDHAYREMLAAILPRVRVRDWLTDQEVERIAACRRFGRILRQLERARLERSLSTTADADSEAAVAA